MDIHTDTGIGDKNTERLLQTAYQPPSVPEEFAAMLEKQLLDLPPAPPAPVQPPAGRSRLRVAALVVGGLAACILLAVGFSSLFRTPRSVKKDVADRKID